MLATNAIPDLHLCATLDGHQCFPLYVYDDDGNRHDNITNWALKTFWRHYKPDGSWAARITKDDIFHYVYAVLHHPGYRATFGDNLKRELPRIPLAPDFRAFAKAGRALATVHLAYDDPDAVEPHPLAEVWTPGERRSWRVERMKLSKDKTTLRVNDALALDGIPPRVFGYRLGNRSALDWVIDQYRVKTDSRTGIESDPNAWGEERDDPEYIVRLVKQVVTVSLRTLDIVGSLPDDFGGPPREE